MNLDSLNGRWLQSDYHLASLSKLVQTSCNVGNFSQLVTVPTRFQYNIRTDSTARSCIDHVYCNTKYRCSNISVTPFGDSDHDLVGYIRLSKAPPSPARTIRKRSYKNFKQEDFLKDLKKVDWTEVYQCDDVDISTSVFTRKFVDVLNVHAPWTIFQQRKHFSPWITETTKDLIASRDQLRTLAEDHVEAAAAADC